MMLRVFIVVAAYVLSAGGLLFVALGAMALLGSPSSWLLKLVPAVWVFAWVAHVRMAFAWVRGRTLDRFWPRWGSVAGVFGLASPLLAVLLEKVPDTWYALLSALIASGLVAVYLSPSIALAVYLVRYHGRTGPPPARERLAVS